LHQMLSEVDPQSAAAIDPNNTKRLIRALEYHHITGQKLSDHNAAQKAKEPAYDAEIIILNAERQLLYSKINQRVDDMIAEGLLQEVKALIDKGYPPNLPAMQALGYKELICHLNGEYNLQTAIDAIKQGTRRFAKRQITWFKHQLPQARWVDISKQSDI